MQAWAQLAVMCALGAWFVAGCLERGPSRGGGRSSRSAAPADAARAADSPRRITPARPDAAPRRGGPDHAEGRPRTAAVYPERRGAARGLVRRITRAASR